MSHLGDRYGGDRREKVRWGDVGIALDREVRHLTFSSEEGVRKPVLGEVYSGAGREGGDR